MKTLIITLEYPPQIGGIASYVYNLAGHLPQGEAVVYAPRQNGGQEFDARNAWTTYRRDPYLLFFWPRWLALAWQIWRIIRQEKIKQLYINHALPVGYAAFLIKKIWRIPYIIFFHGSDVEFDTRNVLKRAELKMVCGAAERIIVNSNFLKNKLVERLGGLPKIDVLYPAPAEMFLAPVSSSALTSFKTRLGLDGKKVIVSAGRLVEGKGFPHLLRLMPEIARQIPNVVWLIIGDGPKRLLLTEIIIKNGLQNVVRLLGWIPYEQLPVVYQAADLFALLTHPDEGFEEGWGTVFIEAGASGLPVVVGRSGGAAEAVEDRVTGLVVDIHQEKAVINDIVELLKNSAYARQMGEAGRERVKSEFTWEKQLLKITKV